MTFPTWHKCHLEHINLKLISTALCWCQCWCSVSISVFSAKCISDHIVCVRIGFSSKFVWGKIEIFGLLHIFTVYCSALPSSLQLQQSSVQRLRLTSHDLNKLIITSTWVRPRNHSSSSMLILFFFKCLLFIFIYLTKFQCPHIPSPHLALTKP